MHDNRYCVIMAGGIGSRFWPMSRTHLPKQFHDVLGVGRTLLQMTYDRFTSFCPRENVLVVTNERYKALVLEQLNELSEDQVLCEPFMRNTAPCIAYAAFRIAERDPNAVMVVAPSDHLILKNDEFLRLIHLGIENALQGEHLVTMGIKPTRPDTGYGYIQFSEDKQLKHEEIKKVKTFTEKPDIELAKDFIESGDFYWNAGIFLWRVKDLIRAFEIHLPEIHKTFLEGKGLYGTSKESAFINEIYPSCANVSVDYGIMEKATNVRVMLSDFGWSDLGTWGSLHLHIPHDSHQNGVVGKEVMLYNCTDNMIHVTGKKLTVIQGLNGYIVVDTEDVLMVCRKEDEQRIKQFVNDIKISKRENYI